MSCQPRRVTSGRWHCCKRVHISELLRAAIKIRLYIIIIMISTLQDANSSRMEGTMLSMCRLYSTNALYIKRQHIRKKPTNITDWLNSIKQRLTLQYFPCALDTITCILSTKHTCVLNATACVLSTEHTCVLYAIVCILSTKHTCTSCNCMYIIYKTHVYFMQLHVYYLQNTRVL